ncbi:3-hydroxyacyl-ACP dehydratase FabZ [Rhodobacteraceae bacterium NNCM2]|nr:3-hydroxyacyl-ACP dehydratase FabZ [Coraliihabitans acroporae]
MKEEAENIESRSVDLGQIQRMIPHRYPFLMIDRVVKIIPNQSAVGIKNVTINEPHFTGHFPQEAVMPGVLIIEAMAQTAGVLVVDTLGKIDEDLLVYFMTIDNTRFRRKVVPGDQLELHVAITQSRSAVYKFHGEAWVDGAKVAEADYSAMIVDPKDERRRG